jgi:hypothetical protein
MGLHGLLQGRFYLYYLNIIASTQDLLLGLFLGDDANTAPMRNMESSLRLENIDSKDLRNVDDTCRHHQETQITAALNFSESSKYSTTRDLFDRKPSQL